MDAGREGLGRQGRVMEHDMTGKWYEQQLRIQQTVLREIDIIDYDVEGVVQYLKDTHANVFIINGGGIVDFFRHDLPISSPNRFMGERDILADVTKACRAAGIRVIVRVDFRGVDKRHYDQHPDWFAVDAEGKPVPFQWHGEPLPETLYAPCYLGWYRNEHAFGYARELFKRYDIDGIWENAPMQMGACYCQRCSEGYRRDLGKELPRGGNFDSPQYDEYRGWKAGKLMTHLKNFQAEVKGYGEDKAFCAEIFGLFYEYYKKASYDAYAVKATMDFMVMPLFVAYHEPLQAPATLVKFQQSLDADKTPVVLYGHLGTANHLRYVSGAPAEVRIWMWQAISAGGSLWDCTFTGQHPGRAPDRRNAYLGSDIFAWMKEHQGVLHGQQPAAAVAILYSQQSDIRFSDNDRSKDQYFTHVMGLEQALLDAHVQYRFIRDADLGADALQGVRLLAVPNAAVLGEREIEAIRAFVAGGGRLLATHQTSLCNPDGSQRADFGLADVFGCHYTGLQKDSTLWGYQHAQPGHPLTAGLEDTELVANWGNTLLVRKHDDQVEAPLGYVPRIYPQPPERAWVNSLQTDHPTVVLNRFGAGECVYFSTPIDRNVAMHGHLDFSRLLANAVRHLLAGANPVTTNAPASVQLALNKVRGAQGKYLLHAINLTAAPRRPIAALVPVHCVEVQLHLPGAKRLKTATALRGEGRAAEISGNYDERSDCLTVSVKLPELLEYTALQLDVE